MDVCLLHAKRSEPGGLSQNGYVVSSLSQAGSQDGILLEDDDTVAGAVSTQNAKNEVSDFRFDWTSVLLS